VADENRMSVQTPGPAAVVSSVLLATLVVAMPRPVPAESPPTFPTRAELVTVDVVVLGPDDKPVPGLTRDDFVVKEDGRVQRIAAFEAVEAMVPGLQSPLTVAASPSQARVATNVAGPPTRRTFAIVFDDLHVGDINIEQAKRAVETFLARQTRPGDRLMLLTTSDARYWTTARGASDVAFTRALERVGSRRRATEPPALRISPVEAMRIAAGDSDVADRVRRRRAVLSGLCVWTGLRCECGNSPPGVAAGPTSRSESLGQQGDGCLVPPGAPSAEEAYARVRQQLERTLRALRQVTRTLGAQRERKALVLVSEGFVVDASVGAFRDVREEAARSNVALYFLDARGLAVGPEFLSAAGVTSAIPAPDVGPTVGDWRREADGARTLAEETGGLVLQTNDLVAGLEKVADESRVTYLLGYEPTNEKHDGRYRKLKVEVRRPGLQVRARAGYFAAKGNEKPVPMLQPVDRALHDVFDADGIPLRLAAYVMGPAPLQTPVPKTGVEVLIAGELRLDALETRSKDGRTVAEPKLKLLTGSREGESHVSDWTLEIALSPALPSAASDVWHPFLTRVAMGPGDHRARLVVQSGERVGSVTADFVVPSASEERLSTPILSDRLVASAAERRVLPLARRSFEATNTLHCWVELHGAAADAATGQPRATTAFTVRSVDGRDWASGPATAMSLEDGKATRLISLPLSQAPTGESELRLTVHDEISGRTFEAREPFRVEAVAASRLRSEEPR
jgi:VWFA-related protein